MRTEPFSLYHITLEMLSHAQIKELLKENFGDINSRYHTLDELPLKVLIAKLSEHQQLQLKVRQISHQAMEDFYKPENIEKRELKRRHEIQELAKDMNKVFTI